MTRTAASSTSATFLTRLLVGLDLTSLDPRRPDFTADEIDVDGARLSLRLFTPSGDAYRLSVEWLSEESP